jgi:transcriptional regulator with XRE-family HTH domain
MCARHWTPAPLASGPLYAARRRQRLTRRELAERSGVSLRTIKRIELGDGGPEYPATRLALALALGVEVTDLQAAPGSTSGSARSTTGRPDADRTRAGRIPASERLPVERRVTGAQP